MGLTLTLPGFQSSYSETLNGNHYLGHRGARKRLLYEDEHGLIVFSGPSSRRIPTDWLELSRWCLLDRAGSKQWAACVRWLRVNAPEVTTIISYSDPSVGHTGALYAACNWVWAPVWHELREPPTGAGKRGGKVHRAKRRWVYLLQPDDRRAEVLRMKDASIARRFPWVGYLEPAWRRGIPQIASLAALPKRWASISVK